MKKLFISLLLLTLLVITTACTTRGTPISTTNSGMHTTGPITNNDEKDPIVLSNYRIVTDFIDSYQATFISVEVEINYDTLVPDYEFLVSNSSGTTIKELKNNDENPANKSCNLALQNANLAPLGSLKCNSMFEISADGIYNLIIKDGTNTTLEIVLDVKGNNVKVVE